MECVEIEVSNGRFPSTPPLSNGNITDDGGGGGQSQVLDIHPLCNYYFASKPSHPHPFRKETSSDRLLRIKSNYNRYGLRTNVEAVMLVELFKRPHLLLLQVRNCTYKLPGGRLRPGESGEDPTYNWKDIGGLKRKLSSKLSVEEDDCASEWEVGECLGMWWRPDFETSSYPYLSPSVRSPKDFQECTKLFLVKLSETRDFIVPKKFKLLAVPMCQIQENVETYGPIVSGIPQLLSKFHINIVET